MFTAGLLAGCASFLLLASYGFSAVPTIYVRSLIVSQWALGLPGAHVSGTGKPRLVADMDLAAIVYEILLGVTGFPSVCALAAEVSLFYVPFAGTSSVRTAVWERVCQLAAVGYMGLLAWLSARICRSFNWYGVAKGIQCDVPDPHPKSAGLLAILSFYMNELTTICVPTFAAYFFQQTSVALPEPMGKTWPRGSLPEIPAHRVFEQLLAAENISFLSRLDMSQALEGEESLFPTFVRDSPFPTVAMNETELEPFFRNFGRTLGPILRDSQTEISIEYESIELSKKRRRDSPLETGRTVSVHKELLELYVQNLILGTTKSRQSSADPIRICVKFVVCDQEDSHVFPQSLLEESEEYKKSVAERAAKHTFVSNLALSFHSSGSSQSNLEDEHDSPQNVSSYRLCSHAHDGNCTSFSNHAST